MDELDIEVQATALAIASVLRTMHQKNNFEFGKSLVITKPGKDAYTIKTYLKYKKTSIVYELKVRYATINYVKVEGGISETENTLIARSKFKYKAIKADILHNDVTAGTKYRIWPITRYWQDVTQLSLTRLGLFDILYGKVAGLLDKLSGLKL